MDRLSDIFQPFITAVNSIPRIALAPIIVLAFGIGDMSKIVTSRIVVVFLVFFNTFEGARSIARALSAPRGYWAPANGRLHGRW
jgi:NitT/TauT family transport system permease protein